MNDTSNTELVQDGVQDTELDARMTAMQIVNRILDMSGADTVKRQAINDECDNFVEQMLTGYVAQTTSEAKDVDALLDAHLSPLRSKKATDKFKEALTTLIAQREQAAEQRGAIKSLKKAQGRYIVEHKSEEHPEFIKGWNGHRSHMTKELVRLAKKQATKPEKES